MARLRSGGRYALWSQEPGSTSIAALKERVKIGLPRIAATVRAWQSDSPDAPRFWKGTFAHGDTVRARNSLYTSMAWQLEPNRGRYWFAAAGMVTGRGGIEDMEGRIPRFIAGHRTVAEKLDVPPEPADLEMIIRGNAFLFPYNLHNWYRLREKPPFPAHGNLQPLRIAGLDRLWGSDLDRALVVLEQSLVEQWLDGYSWAGAEVRKASMLRISKGFSSAHANAWLMKVLEDSVGKDVFDFGNIDHRIRMGIAAVARLRAAGA